MDLQTVVLKMFFVGMATSSAFAFIGYAVGLGQSFLDNVRR